MLGGMRGGTPSSSHSRRRSGSVQSLATIADESSSPKNAAAPVEAPTTATKSRRVRTGCLTCRERHLKCDEATPDCMNCRKSSRECKRGVRLNFIDIQVKNPPLLPLPLIGLDESRSIASEYLGGLNRYDVLGRRTLTPPREAEVETALNLQRQHQQHRRAASSMASMAMPEMSMRGSVLTPAYGTPELSHVDGPHTSTTSYGGRKYRQHVARWHGDPAPSETALSGDRAYLNSPEEVYYMQVFVEEVGVWMDSMDKEKHFSRLIPYHSLKSPMLLNAVLACGVKHLTLVNTAYNDEKALFYYDTATTQLLRSLQNPDRNTAECATAAVVLNVYEIMSEKPAARMNHIAGARALIRECGWNAKSTGVGAACFWLNIGMEVLSCLAFNWQTAWDPDQWGVDMDFSPPDGDDDPSVTDDQIGKEEIWVQRIFYIVGKIANFRATIPKFQEASPHDEQVRLGNRLAQWQDLKRLCDNWNNACPKTMHPFGYLYPSQTESKSAFPNIWLIKRAAIVGRASEEMRAIQLHHAHQVCGIVAHVKDRGVSSVAIRSLAIASSVLSDPREQDEVLEIMKKITKESGWGLGRVMTELKKAWGRDAGVGGAATSDRGPTQPQQQVPPMHHQASSDQASQHQQHNYPHRRATHPQPHMQQQQPQQHQQHRQHQMHTPPMSGQQHQHHHQHLMGPSSSAQQSPPVIAPTPMKAPVNPLSFADFSLPNHPYQNWYEPPSRVATTMATTTASSFNQAFF
ncbi:unnamed protein product [Parascedosporium putredinis]|uniref:Zn(2)-C6 fungal-type domain-containing protein n=1 Tax=Parascedosporium putredinis TaxID=1442378 RepID=A0A9P1H084_9PEZI|nr:unnamed protein product [Parascedosporium putredinis]CAI7991565.1 unnamed protein product [Parascedosporium putredinis]